MASPRWLTLFDPGLDRQYLTDREFQLGWLLATRGLSNAQMAAQLGLTERTIRVHLTHAYRVTGCQSRTQFALWILRKTGIGWEGPWLAS